MSRVASHRRYEVLGIQLDALTIAEAVDLIADRAADAKSPACYVTKPYVEFLDRHSATVAVRRILNDAWLSLPDGVSAQWAAAYLYGGRRHWWRAIALLCAIILYPAAIRRPLPEKFSGINFTWLLLKICAERGLKVYLVSSPLTVSLDDTVAAITKQLPGLKIVGTWPGELAGLRGPALRQALATRPVERKLTADLQAKRPDIILVGMGFPLQEELMAKLTPQLEHGILIGEGGTFDYERFGGRRRKAPASLQRIGLEWLWRLAGNPGRWRRQLAVPRFIWQIIRYDDTA